MIDAVKGCDTNMFFCVFSGSDGLLYEHEHKIKSQEVGSGSLHCTPAEVCVQFLS